MLLSKYFVFVHFPKAGGTFIRTTLEKYMPEDSEAVSMPGHATVLDIPEKYKDVPRIGFVRNPWDWYVSLYSWWQAVKDIDPDQFRGHILEKIEASGKEMNFRDFMARLIKVSNHAWGMGPMSWVYMNMYGLERDRLDEKPANLHIAKFEKLRQELMSFLKTTGMSIPKSLEKAIIENPPVNNFDRKPYSEYYDDKLQYLVLENDQVIIDKYGYKY